VIDDYKGDKVRAKVLVDVEGADLARDQATRGRPMDTAGDLKKGRS
jgi:hypothetical protein